VVMPRPRVDLLVHLRLSDDASGAAAERDALFRLDEAIDNLFGEEYDGSDVDEGPFGTRRPVCGLLFSPHERTRHPHEKVTTT